MRQLFADLRYGVCLLRQVPGFTAMAFASLRWESAIGLALAWALTRAMKNLLYGVKASDPLTHAGVAALLGVIALAACLIPAHLAQAPGLRATFSTG